LPLAKKKLQQARKDNQVLTRYIHARRKRRRPGRRQRRPKKRRRRRPKRRWRRRPRGRRPWWWPDGSMRAKAPWISGLRGSSHSRVV
jgi:hypothetical protein